MSLSIHVLLTAPIAAGYWQAVAAKVGLEYQCNMISRNTYRKGSVAVWFGYADFDKPTESRHNTQTDQLIVCPRNNSESAGRVLIDELRPHISIKSVEVSR